MRIYVRYSFGSASSMSDDLYPEESVRNVTILFSNNFLRFINSKKADFFFL